MFSYGWTQEQYAPANFFGVVLMVSPLPVAGGNRRAGPHAPNFAYRISPVDSKLTPPADAPEARNSRIFPRLAPEAFAACVKTCIASDNDVPSGRRKIHGMLVEVSILSEEIAITGTKAFTPICSARWLES